MDTRILMAVDGSDKGFEAVSILGRLLKDQPGAHLILFHCLQQLQTLAPVSSPPFPTKHTGCRLAHRRSWGTQCLRKPTNDWRTQNFRKREFTGS